MGTPYKMKGSPMQRNFNMTGSSASTTPKYNMKNKGNFNFTGDSKSTTPKYSSTKAAKANKGVSTSRPPTNNPKYKPSNTRIAGPGTRKLSIEAAKKVAKVGKFMRGTTLIGAASELFKGYKNVNPKISKPLTSGKI